jgi:hypothetical protein
MIRLIAGILGVLGASIAVEAEPPGRPNIIPCMADDQGYGGVGYQGNPAPQTPNLDAMAASGLRLDRFLAAAPVCAPTPGGVLTGRHPNRFGCSSRGDELRPEPAIPARSSPHRAVSSGRMGYLPDGPRFATRPGLTPPRRRGDDRPREPASPGGPQVLPSRPGPSGRGSWALDSLREAQPHAQVD